MTLSACSWPRRSSPSSSSCPSTSSSTVPGRLTSCHPPSWSWAPSSSFGESRCLLRAARPSPLCASRFGATPLPPARHGPPVSHHIAKCAPLTPEFFCRVLFLAGAAAASHDYRNATCYRSDVCGQSRALRAFAWITWGFLNGLWTLVLVVACQARSAGRQHVWRADYGSNAGGRDAPLPAGSNRATGEKPVQGAPAADASLA